MADELKYLLDQAALGAKGTPLSLSLARGKSYKPVEKALSDAKWGLEAAAMTYSSMSVFFDR